MEITRDTRVKDLMKEYPWMLEEAVKIDPQFAILKNPLAGAVFRGFSVADAAKHTGIPEQDIMDRIKAMITEYEGAQNPAPAEAPAALAPAPADEHKSQRFFICEHCGNIITMIEDKGVPVFCCGQKMTEIIPGTTDASLEKHVPVYTVEGNKVHVKVGAAEHPMIPEHYIEWISLETAFGNQFRSLKPGQAPETCFTLCEGDAVKAVYAYCNLHSLWKA